MGDEKGIPEAIIKKNEQPELHANKAKKLPSRNAKKLDAIYNEIKEILIEINNLKSDFNNQRNIIKSAATQQAYSEGKEFVPKKNVVFKSKRKSKGTTEMLTEIRNLKKDISHQKIAITSISKQLKASGRKGGKPRIKSTTIRKNQKSQGGSLRQV
jgi:hypothetical protein